MSEIKAHIGSDAQWQCVGCQASLAPATVVIAYLGSEFTVELMRCPGCGMVLVSEELALGKMAEVERLLEDK